MHFLGLKVAPRQEGIEAAGVISMIIFGVGVSAANFQALLLNKVDAEMMCATSRQH